MLHRIVKRVGFKEYFDGRKIYASVFAACMTLRMHDTEAELLANMVQHDVEKELEEKFKTDEISSTQIHKLVVSYLEKYQPDVAYMYDNHRNIF